MDFFDGDNAESHFSDILKGRNLDSSHNQDRSIILTVNDLWRGSYHSEMCFHLASILVNELSFLQDYLPKTVPDNYAETPSSIQSLNSILLRTFHALNLNKELVEAFSNRLRALRGIGEGRKHIQVIGFLWSYPASDYINFSSFQDFMDRIAAKVTPSTPSIRYTGVLEFIDTKTKKARIYRYILSFILLMNFS